MQVFKFSSFTVYCRKRGNFHKLKISKQLGSQFFSSVFTSFSSCFSSVSFFSSFSSEALSFTVRSSSFSATVFALSVSSVAKKTEG